MTTQEERNALYERLREVLGEANTATMEAMFDAREDLATKDDLALLSRELRSEMGELRSDLRGEIGQVRNELAFLRQELELKYATKADLVDMKNSFDETFHSYVRTFIATQAATVVGVTGIVYALVRFT